MTEFPNVVLVDTDFARHSVGADLKTERIIEIYSVIAEKLTAVLHVHPMVLKYEWECKDKAELYKLLEGHALKNAPLEEHFNNNLDKARYYERVVSELLNDFVGIKLEENEVLNNWIYGSSFGEIHSLALCLICGYGCFLSDDNDSILVRNIVSNSYQRDIAVYTRQNIAEVISDSLDFKEYKAFTAFIQKD